MEDIYTSNELVTALIKLICSMDGLVCVDNSLVGRYEHNWNHTDLNSISESMSIKPFLVQYYKKIRITWAN